nr:protein HEXIM1-like [Pelodiscus sinensis]|eukprot:XP_025038903.1 protein HEXIM1-like [Pelodiscus sinensis]
MLAASCLIMNEPFLTLLKTWEGNVLALTGMSRKNQNPVNGLCKVLKVKVFAFLKYSLSKNLKEVYGASQITSKYHRILEHLRRHGRRPSKKKRHWKPYYKLSWEEKKQFDERQSQRASRLRAEMFAKGQPVAPYNTTQFLMEDHDQEEPDLKTGLCPKRVAAKSDDTSEEDFLEEAAAEDGGSDGMGGDGSEFLQRDFSETYERYHVESLQNMSKQELIKEYLELEKCLSRMEDENNRLRVESKKYGGDSAEDSRVRELELELDRLRAENLKLLKENELHRQEKSLSKFGE